MTLAFDVGDFEAFANDANLTARKLQNYIKQAALEVGFAIQGRAVINAMPVHKTGTLEKSIGPPKVKATGKTVTMTLPVTAVSDGGFPYPIVIEEGRGPIVPIRAKFLRFEIGDKVIYTKYVKPYTGIHFFSRAVDATEPEVTEILGRYLDAAIQFMRA